MGEYQGLHCLRRDANVTFAFVLTSLRNLERPTFMGMGGRGKNICSKCLLALWQVCSATGMQIIHLALSGCYFYIMVPFPFPVSPFPFPLPAFPFPFPFPFPLFFLFSFFLFLTPFLILFSSLFLNVLFLCLQLQAQSVYHNLEIPHENILKNPNSRKVYMSKWDVWVLF